MVSRFVPARLFRAVLISAVVPLAQALAQAAPASSPAGAKKPLTVADYSRWRNIEGAGLSPDGKWVAYTLRHMNTLPAESKPSLRILNLDTNQDVEVPNAHDAAFSSDSRWVVYQIDSVPPVRGGRGAGNAAPPADTGAAATAPGAPGTTAPAQGAGRGGPGASATVPPRMELRELATGRTQSWQRMQSGGFNVTSTHLILRRRAATGGRGRGAGGPPAPAAPAAPAGGPHAARGTDAVVHELASGRSLFLGSVGDIAFNRQGDLLAYTVDAQVRDGNGLFLIDLRSGRTHVLDNDTLQYNRLSWSDDGNRLAVLKGRPVEKMRERDNVLMALSGLRSLLDDPEVTPARLDPATAAGFLKGFVVSDRAPLSWSEDGRRVFLAIIPQRAAADTARRPSTDSIANVDVWRTDDERIQSVQMIRAEADRNFTFRQAFDVTDGRYITLTDSAMREVEISLDGRWAVGRDVRAYVSDYKRPAADFYRVNTSTGERTLMMKGQLTGQHALGISPDGKNFLYWKDNRFQTYDLDAGTSRTLGNGTNGFINGQFDYPGPKPSYGVIGYTPDGQNAIVAQRYDLVLVPLDGSTTKSLTMGNGARRELRFRPVRTEPVDSSAPRRVRSGREIDVTKPVTLSAYGEYTKKAGFYRLEGNELKELILDDAVFSTPVRADKADRFLFTRQTFTEFPDLRVSGPALTDSRKISDANPHHSEYMWGRRVLFDYRNKDGVRLQGILALPDDYKPGEKRPMLVSFYEKNSQNMHRYTPPSFITGMGSLPVEALSRGYITMLADIHFRTGSSHSDMLEGVEAATRKVIELGYADPKKIAVHGHSYGGEGAAFIGTRSRLFAAVGMGAGVTDLYSDFSQSWGWSYQVTGGSGANGNEYYMYGQGRWGKSPWDAPELYRNESALAHAPNAVAPFLIMHGTADPTVAFSEGMNFYNALRFNGKKAVMLAYPGEGHGLRGLANRRDLTIRYFQFFDHYLKGAPAPKWMTDGVPYMVKDVLRGDPK